MEKTPNVESAQSSSSSILKRVEMPFLYFSGSLFALLLLSYIAILPRFTGFEGPNNEHLSPRDLLTYERTLTANIVAREKERIRLVLPVQHEQFHGLKESRSESVSDTFVLEELAKAAAKTGDREYIQIHSYTKERSEVQISGIVSGVDARSMTVLAHFVEEIEDLPFVHALVQPTFERVQDADGEWYSPFTITFSL